MSELIKNWVKIGRKNWWIREAYDPEFNEQSFRECKTDDELMDVLAHGNWSLGSAFYYRNMCFINQVNGGDEWLVIRNSLAFESWSCGMVIESKGREHFRDTLMRMMNASEEDLRNLNY